jgi:pantoate--beta-alanine ligase
VNPLQFGPREDYARYPRPLRRDLARARAAGADAVFLPQARELLRRRELRRLPVPRRLGSVLCGPFRPGHFAGVVSIVDLFFRLIRPDRAYFGLKDYQQCRIVEAAARRSFGGRVRIVRCPTVREKDGLAMSSRNRYLRPPERRRAREIYKALREARRLLAAGAGPRAAERALRGRLESRAGARVEYAEVRDAETLGKVVQWKPSGRPLVVACAVRIGGARLIDNLLVAKEA